MDQQLYTHIFNAAANILNNNLNSVGRQFANEFMAAHDIRNPGTQNKINQMMQILANEAQRINGTASFRNDQQLFDIVGKYIDYVFTSWRNAHNQQGGLSFGDMGTSIPINTGGIGQRSGFTPMNQNMGTPSAAIGEVIGGTTMQPMSSSPQMAQSRPQPMTTQDTNMVFGTPSSSSVPSVHNPLDELNDADNLDITGVAASPNWGIFEAPDSSIIVSKRTEYKTRDSKYAINVIDAVDRQYTNDPMDVAKDFFKTAPDVFLAEPFIARVVYNHVEAIDIATDDLVAVRDKFIHRLEIDDHRNPHSIILGILDELLHGPRMSLANYLVKRINRALYLSCGMSESPSTRISFKEIEDLNELLGTSFHHKILEVPNGRKSITNIVITAIINALTHYSEIMFTSASDGSIDVIKNSPIFPFSMKGVYPNKLTIPPSRTVESPDFLHDLRDKHLIHKSYIRQIRTAIFTNILSSESLSRVGDKPTVIKGSVSSLLNAYILGHTLVPSSFESRASDYNEHTLTNQGPEQEYKEYIKNPVDYVKQETSHFVDVEMPSLPVDQTIFAVPYKTSPEVYLAAMDLSTTMDAQRGLNYTLLSTKNLSVLKPSR